MLKLVKFINYSGNYAYAPPDSEAVINTEEIIQVVPQKLAIRPTENIVRIYFRTRPWMDVIGKPSDFIEIESSK